MRPALQIAAPISQTLLCWCCLAGQAEVLGKDICFDVEITKQSVKPIIVVMSHFGVDENEGGTILDLNRFELCVGPMEAENSANNESNGGKLKNCGIMVISKLVMGDVSE